MTNWQENERNRKYYERFRLKPRSTGDQEFLDRCPGLPSLVGRRSGLQRRSLSLFKSLLNLLGNFNFLLVANKLLDEMLKGKAVQRRSGFALRQQQSG